MKIVVCFMLFSGMFFGSRAGLEAAPAPEAKGLRKKTILKGLPLVVDIAFSPDSKLLAVCRGSAQNVCLWDAASAKVSRELPRCHALHAVFSPDGKILATVGRHLKLWEAATGKELATFKLVYPKWILFSADSKMLAAVFKRAVEILSIEKKEWLRRYDFDSSVRPVSAYPRLKQPVLALHRDKGKPIPLMNPFTGKEVLLCENELELLPNKLVSDREEKILAGLRRDKKDRRHERWEVSLWDRNSGKYIASIPNNLYGFEAFTLSPDGKILVLSARGTRPFLHVPLEKSGLSIYEVPSGRLLGFHEAVSVMNFPELQGSHTLVFSPNGRLLATAEGSTVRLWSIPEAWRKKKK